MAIPLFIIGATIIRTAAPAIIKALTKQGAKKIAKPSASQIKKAVSPKNAPKKIQDAIKPKPTGTAARKARRNKTGDSTSKTPADAVRKKQTDQLKQGNGARKAQPPKTTTKTTTKTKPKTPKKTDGRSDIQTRARSSERTSNRTRSVDGEPVNLGANRGAGGKFTPKSPKKADNTVRNLITLGLIGGTGAAVDDSLRKKDAKTDSETVSDKRKKETQLGVKKTRKPTGEMNTSTKKSKKDEIGTEDPSSAPNKTKAKATPIVDDDKKAKNKSKRSVVKDSDRLGIKIARMLGDERSSSQMVKDRIENEKLEDEMNFRKGGMAFGKGGMYKGAKKTYGMKYGGFTRRGMGK